MLLLLSNFSNLRARMGSAGSLRGRASQLDFFSRYSTCLRLK
jgi:hypothetical protein